jgi:hypothetical protein
MISNIPQASAGQNSEQTQKGADGVQILYLSMVHGFQAEALNVLQRISAAYLSYFCS